MRILVVADADVDCTVAGVRGDSDFTVPVGDGVVEHGGEDSAQVVRIDRDEQVRFRACGDVRSSSGEAGHALVQQGSDRHRFGGGVGFGAVGRAVRASMVVASIAILVMTLAIYGQSPNFHLAT